MQKTKPIVKGSKKSKKEPKKITNEEGDPLIANLNDFVTSIKIDYSSKPIYTGGRIVAKERHLYATCNNEISIYNFEQDAVVDRIKHDNQQIVNFCVCPQQKFIVTFTQSFLVRVLILESKKTIQTVKVVGNFANDMNFSPDGRHIAFAFGNSVQIFTFENMRRTHVYNPTQTKFAVTRLQWHPDPERLQIVTCDLQRNLAVFDYIINKVVAVSDEGEGGSDFCMNSSGNLLASINNMEIRIYETKGLKLNYKIPTEAYMESLLFVDHILYLGGQDTELFSLNLNEPTQLIAHKNCTDNGIMKIMASCSNKKLLVLSQQQNITVVKLNSHKNLVSEGLIIGYNDEIIDIKNSSSSYFVLVTNSNNVKVIDKSSHKLKHLIKGHTNTVLCAEYWHPYIATAGKDRIIKLWKFGEECSKINLLANYNGHAEDVLSIVFLKNSKIIASVSDDFTIKLWPMCLEAQKKVQIRSSLRTAIAHSKAINAVRVSPKEDLIATCSQDKTVKLWTIQLNNVLTLAGHRRGVWDAAFHPIEEMIVSVSGDGMIKGWSLQTGQCTWSMGEGAALIRCSWIYYNQVITGSFDGIVKIWDVRKQTSLSYDKHEGKIWALDITKAENKVEIMTGATDSVYHVWTDNTMEMKETIMHKIQMEEQERIFYSQHMQDKKYCEAAIIAFKGNYIKLFINVLEQISTPFNPNAQIKFDEDQQIIVEEDPTTTQVTEEQFSFMVSQLRAIDLERLLITLQEMNSTVRHYKMANKILNEVFRQTSFSELAQLNKHFNLPIAEQSLNQFNEKKSGLERWLQNMVGSCQKHNSRINRYIEGTYWIEHLYKMENPLR